MVKDITEIPEKWVILKVPNNVYKVFGTWNGGYLGSDRWKLNSGIVKIEQDEEFFYFFGFSGSCYKCSKNGYGTASSSGETFLNMIIKMSNGEIELMGQTDNWKNLI